MRIIVIQRQAKIPDWFCFPRSVGRSYFSENFFLCQFQVALGQCHELLQADNNAHRLPDGFSSVKGLGSTAPNPTNALTL